jgi:ferredoxin
MEPVKVQLTCKGHTETFELRKGLGLQVLEKQTDGIEYDCREADCGICIIRVHQGADHISPPTPAEADFLKAMRAEDNERLACQCRVFGNISIEVEDWDVL